MTDKPITPERLRHIKDQYERWGEAALERACGELLAEIDRLRERAERAEMRLGEAYDAIPKLQAAESQLATLRAQVDRARADALGDAVSACLDLTGSEATPTLRSGARMCVRRISQLKGQKP